MKITRWTEYKKNQKLKSWGFIDPVAQTSTYKRERQGENKMVSIKDKAEAYVSPTTKTIDELNEVLIDVEVLNKDVPHDDPKKAFNYNYITVDGVDYRMPDMVLKQLQIQLEEKPSATRFKVVKKGTGLNTEYQVVMLD